MSLTHEYNLRRETRALLGIAMPLTAAYLAEMGMVITDMIIVGRLGATELAAVGLAGDLVWIFLLIGMGMVSVVGVFTAQSLGEGNHADVIGSAEQGMWVATLAAIPIIGATWWLGPLLALTGQDPTIATLGGDYARMLTGAVFPALWFMVLRYYVIALASSLVIFWITLAALGLNLLLNWTLVYGELGFPAMGVRGAGLGTSIVNWLMFGTMVVYVYRSSHLAAHRPQLVPRKINIRLLKEMLSLGFPVALTHILNGGMFSVAAILAGLLSPTVLAAQQILYGLIYLALSTADGMADAVSVRVAYAAGSGEIEGARKTAILAFSLAAGLCLPAIALLWLQPELVAGIFLETDDRGNQEAIDIAIGLTVAAGVFMLLDSTQVVLADTLHGLKDAKSPVWVSFLGYWVVGLGLGSMLCFPIGFGIEGLWWGLVAGVALGNSLLAFQLQKRFRERTHS